MLATVPPPSLLRTSLRVALVNDTPSKPSATNAVVANCVELSSSAGVTPRASPVNVAPASNASAVLASVRDVDTNGTGDE